MTRVPERERVRAPQQELVQVPQRGPEPEQVLGQLLELQSQC